jgi:chemotaxis protein histidine kinase CheA
LVLVHLFTYLLADPMSDINFLPKVLPEEADRSADVAEILLQQELQSMFEVDTQEYLETYVSLVQQIKPQSWTADIQELYRCVHTVKGGAVTVGADAILHISTVLEDVLSDLRFLQVSPPLEDGHLSQILLEAGELLIGSLQIQATGAAAVAAVRPTVERINTLRQEVQKTYLPQWSEQDQLFQEFADQGFDLVVLDLEIALEQFLPQCTVPIAAIETAKQTLAQLQQIGQDLELEVGWVQLLEYCQVLCDRSETDVWINQWPIYLQRLKASARSGGKAEKSVLNAIAPLEIAATSQREAERADFDESEDFSDSSDLLETLSLELEFPDSEPEEEGEEESAFSDDFLEFLPQDLHLLDFQFAEELAIASDPLASSPLAETFEQSTGFEISEFSAAINGSELVVSVDAVEMATAFHAESAIAELESELSPEDRSLSIESLELLPEDLDFLDFSLVDGLEIEDSVLKSLTFSELSESSEIADISEGSETVDFSELVAASIGAAEDALESATAPSNADVNSSQSQTTSIPPSTVVERSISTQQIPVPLERLERSAQHLVETILSARAAQGTYRNLQAQLVQLVTLAQDSTTFVTRLRQVQDEYALLGNIQEGHSNPSVGPILERYRQGYSIINRLLETSLRLAELGAEAATSARQTAESLQSLDRNIMTLQQTVEESRLVPFKTLGFRARGILRDLSNRFGKPARLVVYGEQLELDAGTVQALEPILLHLLRNSYDHGLETSEERIAQGKPEQGTVTLSLKRQGNAYLLAVQDDGRGIDRHVIHQLAQAKGLLLTQTDIPSDLLAVICQPGFSSQSVANAISGRGVGMDVVANRVASLGGQLELSTEVGIGTTFHIQIPVPHLLVRCVLVQVGDRTFAIPSEEINITTLFANLTATPVEGTDQPYSWMIEQADGSVPGLDLMEYWQSVGKRSLAETAIGLRIRTRFTSLSKAQQDVWLIADDLLEQVDLLINPLPNLLRPPMGLMGVTMLPNGRLIPVLEPIALAERLLTQSRKPMSLQEANAPATAELIAEPELPQQSAAPTFAILVVDDAALVRRRLEGSLVNYGFTVYTCRDGLEAWNWLQSHDTPTLMITDIEMPGMDGFTLIDRCKQADMQFPILVSSSRLSEEWGAEARRLGAADYLTKGFTTSELLNKVNALINAPILV